MENSQHNIQIKQKAKANSMAIEINTKRLDEVIRNQVIINHTLTALDNYISKLESSLKEKVKLVLFGI